MLDSARKVSEITQTTMSLEFEACERNSHLRAYVTRAMLFTFMGTSRANNLRSTADVTQTGNVVWKINLNHISPRSLTLREEHRLGTSENRVVRRIFGPRRDEVAGGWSTVHNEELHNFSA
jgi:hypothetical protein